MRFLIIFIFFLSNALANDVSDIKNIIINKELKTYNNLTFLDSKDKKVTLDDFKGKLVIFNFWATWCLPCKEEMPSLDSLKINPDLDNLEIIPINVGQESVEKSKKFFDDLNIKNLEIYFDNPITLAKELSLRGIPTTILFNKDGKEFARIIGSINFNDKKFVRWLTFYN
jgi:thiol-disulfide isomerase/thioredoxin